ncbi:MAG: NACHT domain-containing protein [Alphaproteobacteria bacterium]|nr:MAG: NACHT domain-containing protein [Alphaproteobacteria bacterium]
MLKPSQTLVQQARNIPKSRKQQTLSRLSATDLHRTLLSVLFGRQGLECIDNFNDSKGEPYSLWNGKDLLGTPITYASLPYAGKLNRSLGSLNALDAVGERIAEILKTTRHIKGASYRPSMLILCSTGSINQSAQETILIASDQQRIIFWDDEILIEKVDSLFPEYWQGIHAEKLPYIQSLHDYLLGASDIIAIADAHDGAYESPITDSAYVPLTLQTIRSDRKKVNGRVHYEPKVVEMSLDGLLSQRERMFLILGDGGTGKTTALRRIAYVLSKKHLNLDETVPIPVLLNALEVARADLEIIDVIAEATAKVSRQSISCVSPEDLENGNLALLIDGLDEVSDDSIKVDIVNKLSRFHQSNPKCLVVLASRDTLFVSSGSNFAEFSRYRLTSLTFGQASMIVQRVARGRNLPTSKALEVIRQLKSVHGMDLNPFLVTIFASASDIERKDIPPNITEIFKKFTEQMLGRWDERKGLSQQIQSEVKDFLLCQIAYEMHLRGETHVAYDVFKDRVVHLLSERGYSRDVDVYLDEIIYRSGLLKFYEGRLYFRHHLLQEFFAGRGVQDSSHFTDKIYSDWWRKPIMFHFGDRPSSVMDLYSLSQSVPFDHKSNLFQSAVTIGLALQALYLAKVDDRLMVLRWVIYSLSDANRCLLSHLDNDNDSNKPLAIFLFYYIMGREAVASELVELLREDEELYEMGEPSDQSLSEQHDFWLITGMIESGMLLEAEKAVVSFRPEDKRLLLAIVLGCFFTAHLKVATGAQRKIADRIGQSLVPSIGPLLNRVEREARGVILEMHQGQVKALDASLNPNSESISAGLPEDEFLVQVADSEDA